MLRLRIALYILIGFVVLGCLESKEIRRSNRASRKLEKVTKRFPELLIADTVRAEMDFAKPKTELFVSVSRNTPDSMSWKKGDATLIRVVSKDSTFYTVICDTVIVTNTIKIPVEKIQPVQYFKIPLTWWQKALMFLGVLALLYCVFKLFR